MKNAWLAASLRSERGSAPAAVLVWTAAAGLILAALLALGVANAAHGRAQAAADLAALSGSDAQAAGGAGCAIAQEVAARNGASLTSCAVRGEVLTVEVSLPVPLPAGFGERTVHARATAGPDPREIPRAQG